LPFGILLGPIVSRQMHMMKMGKSNLGASASNEGLADHIQSFPKVDSLDERTH
jgi:hypothetical protein